MSLPLHLQSIKSSGVYRFVFDKSVVPAQVSTTLRLLVGYSEKGPFNSPVYITSREEFITTFGNISKRLEKKGVFFHRLALQALAYGPILCLNLKPFNKDSEHKESVQYTAFKASEIYDVTVPETGVLVTNLYDTNRFWALDADRIPSVLATNGSYINITATDTVDASCSLIMRPARPEQYDLTIREWYAGVSDEMPEYLIPIQDEKLNKYFMDVYVFRGKFTKDLCGVNGVLGKYFNVTGDDTITLEENYVDAFGEPADVLEALANDEASNFIVAYRGTTIPYFKGTNGNYLSIDLLFNSGFSDHKMLMKLDETLLEGDATDINEYLCLDIDSSYNYYEKTENTYKYELLENPTSAQQTAAVVETSVPENPTSSSEEYIKVLKEGSESEYDYYKLVVDTYIYAIIETPSTDVKDSAEFKMVLPKTASVVDPDYIKVPKTDKITYFKANGEESGTFKYLELTDPESADYKKALKKAVEVDPTHINPQESGHVNYTTAEDYGQYIKTTFTVDDINISPVYIKGFTYTSMNGSTDYVADSIGVITDDNYGKGLQEALTNRVDSEYHYIVDTYDTVAGPVGANTKAILAAIAKKKDNAFAILNFPKIKDFVNAGAIYKTNGTLDFKKICKKAVFPLPDDADGASWAAYFTQVILSDGTVKSVVPAAGLISNLFEDKWTSRQPYYIVAGSQYGRLIDSSLVGPDYSFSKADRDILEPYGINVLVYEPRRGTYINSEQTLKQIPVSGLSKIHIRELVIYLQNTIAELLESYRWELNTQVLRQTIKGKADAILERVKDNGGVYDYQNICDDSNNTPETIDNEFLILSTHIEPAKGSGKMVEELYIYRTGEMRSQLIQG